MNVEALMARYIDLFAGCGGLSLGLLNSGWEGVFAIEKNEWSRRHQTPTSFFA